MQMPDSSNSIGAALMGLLTILGTFVEYGTTSRSARWFGAGWADEAVREGVQASYLAAATDMVRADFGGMEGYLRDALGIDSAARERLAALYLEG